MRFRTMPPVRDRVVTTDGRQLIGPGENIVGQHVGVIETFRWLRVIGDTIFAFGAIALALFVIGLRTGGSTRRERFGVAEPEPLQRPL